MNESEIKTLINKLSVAESIEHLKQLKSQYLSKHPALLGVKSEIKTAKFEDKRNHIAKLQNIGKELDKIYQSSYQNLLERLSRSDSYDFTLPLNNNKYSVKLKQNPSKSNYGIIHPSTVIKRQLAKIFKDMGYSIVDSVEIETQDNNFTKLNIPEGHPARDSQDTFYLNIIDKLGKNLLLRTHTSNEQIRFLEKVQLDLKNLESFKLLSIGMVHRNEDEDSTHLVSFNQVEALVIASKIQISDLIGTLQTSFQALLGTAKVRLRNNYFPFTEPSFEMDAYIGGKWLEIGGCGMVHPKVLENCGITGDFNGFAFGFGIERIVNIIYNLENIKQLNQFDFYHNNLESLK